MKPIAHFEAVWNRCALLSGLHGYLAKNVSGVLQPDELLRAEWVARVSALDLYVHELVAQSMLATFEGSRPASPAYLRFQISNKTLGRIRAAADPLEASAAFDFFVRHYLRRITYQAPDEVADGIRLCSTIELWNEIALMLGGTPATKIEVAKKLKTDLSVVVQRRNTIVHEGDLQRTSPREPFPINQMDLVVVAGQIERIVRAIDALV